MNVTLGVPRLRELLMVASINVKTPTMEVPILHSSSALRKAKRLQRRWSRLLFSQVITTLNIHDKLTLKLNDHKRTYKIEFHFDEKYGQKQLHEILRSFEIYFIPRLCRAINKKRKELTASSLLRSANIRDKITINDSNEKDNQQETAEKDDEDEDDDDDEPVRGEANAAKEKDNRNDEKEYDDDDDMGENETDDEEAIQDNQDENDQPSTSKITIKEDIIDDNDDVQGKKIYSKINKILLSLVLDVSKEEIIDDDEQEVPGNDDGEPPSKKSKKITNTTTDNTTYNERFGVCIFKTNSFLDFSNLIIF